ncbi:MAG: threonylcarbamoyl-AMP synthase [Betaproteobacteria bacterium]|nr:threonylcarbamoyl-AMP synthase [Betaproteobacteria bacterium]
MTVSDIHGRIAAAAALLKKGGVVAFPTETVYGLGAEVCNPSAVQRIFEIKGRPSDHPLIVHVADASRLRYWAEDVPEQAWRLAEHFWPGPLTLILPRSRRVPENVTGGQGTVGLRVPAHPVALALLDALGPEGALAAPSANRFGHVSPTTAAHVREELGDSVDMILDGGPCEVGLESTIVGFEGQGIQKSNEKDSRAVILRPGGISLAALAEVLDGKVVLAKTADRTLRVPGALASHYAPSTPLELLSSEYLPRRALELEERGLHLALVTWSAQCAAELNHGKKSAIFHFPMPPEPENYGRLLYATLRRLDLEGFDCLLIEAPPDEPAWIAVADRLRRASCIDVLKTSKNEAVYG